MKENEILQLHGKILIDLDSLTKALIKKEAQNERLRELLARAIVLNQIYNDMSPTLEHCLDDIKRADFSPEIEQARELVRGIE